MNRGDDSPTTVGEEDNLRRAVRELTAEAGVTRPNLHADANQQQSPQHRQRRWRQQDSVQQQEEEAEAGAGLRAVRAHGVGVGRESDRQMPSRRKSAEAIGAIVATSQTEGTSEATRAAKREQPEDAPARGWGVAVEPAADSAGGLADVPALAEVESVGAHRSGTGPGTTTLRERAETRAGGAADAAGAHVDAILEEAVQSLPDELPFQQVDRIEYMNAQKRLEREREAATGAAAGGDSPQAGAVDESASARRSSPPFNLTLVTQTDSSRLHYLAEGAARFRGPIAAAVLVDRDGDLASTLGGRRFGPHVSLLPVEPPPTANHSYPINMLRNTAIRAVRTTHFLVLDVDLWPSASAYTAVMAAPHELLRRKYTALVLPAFELDLSPPVDSDADAAVRFFRTSFHHVPRTVDELRECLGSRRCTTFYAHTSPETHGSTPYAEWWKAKAASEPLPIPCFQHARYEPYVVLPNLPTTPIYSEAFTGYGKNKIELVTHLRFAGFKFYALPAVRPAAIRARPSLACHITTPTRPLVASAHAR